MSSSVAPGGEADGCWGKACFTSSPRLICPLVQTPLPWLGANHLSIEPDLWIWLCRLLAMWPCEKHLTFLGFVFHRGPQTMVITLLKAGSQFTSSLEIRPSVLRASSLFPVSKGDSLTQESSQNKDIMRIKGRHLWWENPPAIWALFRLTDN